MITEKTYRFELPDGKKAERIDSFLAQSLENATRNRVQNLIKAGLVLLNGKTTKPSRTIGPGDIIEISIPCAPRPETNEPEDIPIDVVYEDQYILIVNKPAGLVVHPAFGHFTGTLVNAVLFHNKSEGTVDFRPGIVHRIDKETSGLLVIAKDQLSHARLARQFYTHKINRLYWAVVWGHFKETEGTVEGNIARSRKDRKLFTVSKDEGKEARTHYRVLEEFEFASLIELRLETGRTHQIRVHMSHTGHPVFGDPQYGGRTIHSGSGLPKIKSRVDNLLEIMPRQALHAKTLGFIHPYTKEQVDFNSDLPEDFILLIKKLRQGCLD